MCQSVVEVLFFQQRYYCQFDQIYLIADRIDIGIADRIDIDVGIKYGGSLSSVKYTTSVSIWQISVL